MSERENEVEESRAEGNTARLPGGPSWAGPPDNPGVRRGDAALGSVTRTFLVTGLNGAWPDNPAMRNILVPGDHGTNDSQNGGIKAELCLIGNVGIVGVHSEVAVLNALQSDSEPCPHDHARAGGHQSGPWVLGGLVYGGAKAQGVLRGEDNPVVVADTVVAKVHASSCRIKREDAGASPEVPVAVLWTDVVGLTTGVEVGNAGVAHVRKKCVQTTFSPQCKLVVKIDLRNDQVNSSNQAQSGIARGRRHSRP